MSDDKSFGKGFNLDYDQRNIISSGLNGVTEVIQRGSYRVNHIPRPAIRMDPDARVGESARATTDSFGG